MTIRNILAYGVLFVMIVSACQSEQKSEYGSWQEDFHVGIAKTLATNHIKGCGEFKYRESTKHPGGEYKVFCTADGKNWVAYLVWPKINEVMGPYAADES